MVSLYSKQPKEAVEYSPRLQNDLTLLQLLKQPIYLYTDLVQIDKTYVMLQPLLLEAVPSIVKDAGINLPLIFVGLSKRSV